MSIIPGQEKYNLLLILQTFQLCVAASTAHNTSPLCRYYTRTSLLVTEVQYLVREKILNEDCNSLIYWVLWHCQLNSLLERSWRHLFGHRLCNITDFCH